MRLIVLDASVAVKWYLPRQSEPLVDAAFDLLSGHANQEVAFLTPDLFWAEFGNVMWKSVRQGRLSEQHARLAISEIRGIEIDVTPSGELLPAAFTIAISNGRSFYDSVYVALAIQSGTSLVTADERLANALGARFPVKWLGSFSAT